MREALPGPILRRKAFAGPNASTSLKSRESAPGTWPTIHVVPPSVVRKYVPCVPLTHATLELTALTPRNLSRVPLCWFVHCAKENADTTNRSMAVLIAALSCLTGMAGQLMDSEA